MTEPTWSKQLGNFILLEYPKEPNFLNCTVTYQFDEYELDGDDEESLTFAFGSWGCDRELITEEDCLLCCQGMQAYDANVSMSSFYSNLEYIRTEIADEEE
ncbi:MAG TPA: hypothetical protein DCP31_09985 [Cyanobacteria bacterium UBA8543]|nr:hypothetical protein [Cyanobacteria bacterium UBA8543]